MLFLDEIGEIPPGLQPKLHAFCRSTNSNGWAVPAHMRVDVRVVAATDRGIIPELVDGDKRFGSICSIVLNVFPITLASSQRRSGAGISPALWHGILCTHAAASMRRPLNTIPARGHADAHETTIGPATCANCRT